MKSATKLMLRLAPTCWGIVVFSALLAGSFVFAAETSQQQPRKLAPGVLVQAPPAFNARDTVSRHDILQILVQDPTITEAKSVALRRTVWQLRFQFKPMRMIVVDLPSPTGYLQRKNVWYLVYTVSNPGKALRAVQDQDGTYRLDEIDQPVFFIPQFRLVSDEVGVEYPDQVIPAAVAAIQLRERPGVRLLNTVEMTREIKVGETYWGVATWVDVDPRIDRFSVLVGGLTNAYRYYDDPNQVDPSDPLKGKRFERKWLKINFWRPGDEYFQHEKEFRLGIPGQVDFEWIYR